MWIIRALIKTSRWSFQRDAREREQPLFVLKRRSCDAHTARWSAALLSSCMIIPQHGTHDHQGSVRCSAKGTPQFQPTHQSAARLYERLKVPASALTTFTLVGVPALRSSTP